MIKRKRSLALFLPALLLCAALAPAAAQTATPQPVVLTMDQAVAYALEHNNAVKQAQLTLESSKEALDLSWTSSMPSLNTQAGLNLGAANTAAGTTGSSSTSASLTVAASLGASTFTAQKTASLAYESSLLALVQKKRSLELAVRTDYISLLLSKAQITLSSQKMDRAQNTYGAAQTKFKNGLISELEVLKAQLALEQLKPTHESLLVTYDNALDSFKIQLGMGLDQELDVSGELGIAPAQTASAAKPDPAALESDLLTRIASLESLAAESADMQTLKASLASAQWALESARLGAYAPTVSLALGASAGLGDLGSEGLGANLNGTASLTVSYNLANLFDWSDTQQALRSKARIIQDLNLQIQDAQAKSLLSIRNLTKQIRQTLGSLKVLRFNEELATKTYSLELAAYRNGTSDLSSLQTTEGDLESTRIDLMEKQFSLLTSTLSLENACGLELGSLGRNTSGGNK